MLQFIRFLKGYLLIRVCGNAPERFINLCSNHQIFLWDIQIHEEFYTMKIGLSDFYRIKGFTRKTGTKVVVTERFGLPFLSVGIKKRKVFLAGIIISVCPYLDDSDYRKLLYYRGCLHGFSDRERDCTWDDEE